MMPLDPVQPASTENQNPMAPPYVNEDPDMEMLEKGLQVAENEKRDAVIDSYEDAALSSDDPQAELDDINYPKSDAASGNPELSAIKEDKRG